MKLLENSKYVHMGNEEFRLSKREILLMEAEVIKAIQAVKEYRALRKREINEKKFFLRKMRELRLKISSLEASFPERSPEPKKTMFQSEGSSKLKSSSKDSQLLQELNEIQMKLRALDKI